MNDETHSSAIHGEKPSDWQNAPTGSPSGVSNLNVTSLRMVQKDGFGAIREDIEEFTEFALKEKPFSTERLSYQSHLSLICQSDAPDDVRQDALRGLLKTSDWNFIKTVPGYAEIINEVFSDRRTSK